MAKQSIGLLIFISMPPERKAYGYDQDNGQTDDDDFDQLNGSSVIGFLNAELFREKRFQIMNFPDGMPANGREYDYPQDCY
jgi:hypothetical protein